MKHSVEDKIEQLYLDKREDLVRMYKSRAGGNDVEDLVQEAFYRALVYKDTYKENLVELEFWFVGILNNCLKDLLREKQNGSSMHDPLNDEDLTVEIELDSGWGRVLAKEVAKKSGDAKQICYLYFIMGYQLSEIQRIIGCSYSNVDNVVDRFKNLLREGYSEYDSI